MPCTCLFFCAIRVFGVRTLPRAQYNLPLRTACPSDELRFRILRFFSAVCAMTSLRPLPHSTCIPFLSHLFFTTTTPSFLETPTLLSLYLLLVASTQCLCRSCCPRSCSRSTAVVVATAYAHVAVSISSDRAVAVLDVDVCGCCSLRAVSNDPNHRPRRSVPPTTGVMPKTVPLSWHALQIC